MARHVVDRFEGSFAVLEDEDGKTFLVPRRWLPSNAREGDVVNEVEYSLDADTASLRLELDPQARAERLAAAKKLREQLPRGPQGDVPL